MFCLFPYTNRLKYAAHCYYTRKYKNYWVMNIVFTKHLQAHFKVCLCKIIA